MYTHTHTHKHSHINTHTRIHTHTHTHTHTHIYTHACAHCCTHIHTQINKSLPNYVPKDKIIIAIVCYLTMAVQKVVNKLHSQKEKSCMHFMEASTSKRCNGIDMQLQKYVDSLFRFESSLAGYN